MRLKCHLNKESTNSLCNHSMWTLYTLREETSQINIILQQKLPAVKLSVVCTVYKQWLYVVGNLCLQLSLNPLGTGDLFYQSEGLNTFWALLIFLIKLVFYLSWWPILLIIHHTSRAHGPVTIVYYFVLYHQVYDALNDIIMTPPWCYNRGTYMSFQSGNQGWTYMSFQSSKG